jgi:hypothetical protein
MFGLESKAYLCSRHCFPTQSEKLMEIPSLATREKFFNKGPVDLITIVRHENPWRSQSDFQNEPFKQGMFTTFVIYMKLSAIFLRHRIVGATAGRYSVPLSGRSRIVLKMRIPARAYPRGNRVHRTSDLGVPRDVRLHLPRIRT